MIYIYIILDKYIILLYNLKYWFFIQTIKLELINMSKPYKTIWSFSGYCVHFPGGGKIDNRC